MHLRNRRQRGVGGALLILALCCIPAGAQEPVSQADLLLRLIDLDRLTRPPAGNERYLLFSSYDRRQHEVRDGRYVHWDGDDDSGNFIRKTDDGWGVMADVDGPGAILHVWADEPAGEIRILLDGDAVIEAPFLELFSGGVEPFGEPLSYFMHDRAGANLYFPIGFGRSCRVLCRGFDGRYQINAVRFSTGTRVERFDPKLEKTAQKALQRVVLALSQGLGERELFGEQSTQTVAGQQELKQGEAYRERFEGAGTIRAIQVALTDRFAPRDLYVLHNLVIRLWWDGSETPAIELPLSALFGTGFQRNLYNSLVAGTDLWVSERFEYKTESHFMYFYLPMPFRDGARLEVVNLNREKVDLMVYLRVDQEAPAEDRLRLYATYHLENPCKTFDFPMLEATGPGRVVGCVLNIDTPRRDWWGRGDHKIWLDGEAFPSVLGTGTADYFGAARSLRGLPRPLQGATLVNAYGKNSLYRWHIADSIDFMRSIRLTIENWQPNNANDVYYNSIVFWYGPPKAKRKPERFTQERLELPGLRIPNAVEIEGHVLGSGWGNIVKQKYERGIEFSGKQAVVISTDQPVTIEIPSDLAGNVRLKLRTHPNRSFEKIEVRGEDGALIGVVEYEIDADGMYTVGEWTVRKGVNRVSVTCSKPVILDCWIVEPMQ